MIRVLHIVGKMQRAGQETFIMNLYRNINRDLIQFDFVVHTEEQQDYDDEIRILGGIIHYVPPMTRGKFKHYYALKKVIMESKYQIIHRHTANSYVFIDLLAAKSGGVTQRIVHSHNNLDKHKVLNAMCRPFLNILATKRFACSEWAGHWLYGIHSHFEVISNAIDESKYIFNQDIRNQYRNELGFKEEDFVIGHVGRFVLQKNHKFIIELFCQIVKLNTKSKLILIGDGELINGIREYAKELHVVQNILFLGSRSDVPQLMQMMDVFLMPSLYEGLGIVGIEAQAVDLPCFFSENIPEETVITNNVNVLKLCEGPERWAQTIMTTNFGIRKNQSTNIISSGFDIKSLVKKLERIYLEGKC